MFYQAKKVILVCLILLSAQTIWANEGAEKEEAPAEGGGGHGGGAEKKDVNYSGSQSDEWNELSKQYQAAKTKYENAEKKYETMRDEFNGTTGDLTEFELKEFKKAKEELDKAEDDYKQLEKDFILRFPERGLEKGRLYKRDQEGGAAAGANKKALEEQPQSLEGKVQKLNKKIGSQYGGLSSSENTSKVKKKSKQDAGKTSEQEYVDPTDDVTRKIKLEK